MLLFLFIRTGQEGFEPPTPWSVATCSSPLSYKPLTRESYNNILCSIDKQKNYFFVYIRENPTEQCFSLAMGDEANEYRSRFFCFRGSKSKLK